MYYMGHIGKYIKYCKNTLPPEIYSYVTCAQFPLIWSISLIPNKEPKCMIIAFTNVHIHMQIDSHADDNPDHD